MKKIIALLLACMMLLSACGKPAETTPVETPDSTTTAPGAVLENPIEEEKIDYVAELKKGTVDNLTYSNSIAKISITAPEGSTVASEDQLMAIFGIGTDTLAQGDTDVKEQLDEHLAETTTPLFMATFPDGVSNLKYFATLVGKDQTEEEYLATTQSELVAVMPEYTFSPEPEEVKLGGSVYTKIVATSSKGVQEIFVQKMDRLMLVLIYSYTDASATLAQQSIGSISTPA